MAQHAQAGEERVEISALLLGLCGRRATVRVDYGFTLGSHGSAGRSFSEDLAQASFGALGMAFLGGVVFNCFNLLLVSGLDIAGIAVAFPIGVGIASALGTVVNYVTEPKGKPCYCLRAWPPSSWR